MIGWLSADSHVSHRVSIDTFVSRLSTDRQWPSTDCHWLAVERQYLNDRRSTDYRSTVGRFIGRQSIDSRPMPPIIHMIRNCLGYMACVWPLQQVYNSRCKTKGQNQLLSNHLHKFPCWTWFPVLSLYITIVFSLSWINNKFICCHFVAHWRKQTNSSLLAHYCLLTRALQYTCTRYITYLLARPTVTGHKP